VTAPGYCGLYINLDRSPERRTRMEQQLADLNLEAYYRRFPAVDGKTLSLPNSPLKPGEIGVFLSHCRALEQARSTGQCVHMLEDDALLSRHVAPVIEDAIAAQLFDRYDLVFTDMMVHCHIGFMKVLKQHFDGVVIPASAPLRLNQLRMFDLTKVFYGAFQSYIVGRKSVDNVIALYKEEIARGPAVPVDIFIQQQVLSGKLKATCLFPFITSFRLEDVVSSTIADAGEHAGQPTIMVMAVLRYLFFAGCDLALAKRVLDTATASLREKPDMRRALMAQVAEFVLSDDFTGA
jgi:GR25 family glycosyltransferase involved in LPS biosynthesis